jgi:GntR family negative regulator for fad regulon and positive regulator of fabA
MNTTLGRLFRPAQYAEHNLLTSILNGTYLPGETLPSERELAKQMGVTRPTLRETLKRLASEGWMTIRQGKATVMNDYWREGGLGLLSTMSKYGEFLPVGFITNLLEIRVILFPAMGRLAAQNAPGALLDFLNDFASIFSTMAIRYFSRQKARDVSRAYYLELLVAIPQGGEDVERAVKDVMEKSLALWKEFKKNI